MTQDICNKLSTKFKIDPKICEEFELFYSDIEKNIKLRHLSHLVSTVEDKINDIYIQRYITPLLISSKYTEEEKKEIIRRNHRLYSIKLRQINGLNCKAKVMHLNYGSIIVYNPKGLNNLDIRILVAHEIGHIINLYISRSLDTQNRANLFSFFAINGRDKFYKNEAEHFTYKDQIKIIEHISKICPISSHNQIN